MKIFDHHFPKKPNFSNPSEKQGKDSTGPTKPPRQRLSADQIRERAYELSIKNGNKTKSIKPEDPKEPSFSDVKNNDPNSSVTHEKLKEALNVGMVNFSGREKEILGKILGNS